MRKNIAPELRVRNVSVLSHNRPGCNERRAQQRHRLGMRTMGWAVERHTPGHGGRICPVAVRPQQRSIEGTP